MKRILRSPEGLQEPEIKYPKIMASCYLLSFAALLSLFTLLFFFRSSITPGGAITIPPSPQHTLYNDSLVQRHPQKLSCSRITIAFSE